MAATPAILQASATGLIGLLAGLLPVTIVFLIMDWVRFEAPSAVSLPLAIAGILFAGLCAGYFAAWRLRPHGVRGRRLAGQLSVLFLEAIVLLFILVPSGADLETSQCPVGCVLGDETIATIAVIGWPVAAVGALAGSHLFVRRLLDRGVLASSSEPTSSLAVDELPNEP